MSLLGVNIDHVATLRQARREFDPDPILAAEICERAGADSIVAHLREDRRHINDKDVKRLRTTVRGRFNLEMSINKEIVDIALKLKPDQVTLVPEKRQEVTTEGGLDASGLKTRLKKIARQFTDKGIEVSLFIDPIKKQIDASQEIGVPTIELHTGEYACAKSSAGIKKQFQRLADMTAYAYGIGLIVNAGHGLKYDNTRPIAEIPHMNELNIGHAIITRAVFVGLPQAVREMVGICKKVRSKS